MRSLPSAKSRFVYEVRDGKQYVIEYAAGEYITHGPYESAAEARQLIMRRKPDPDTGSVT